MVRSTAKNHKDVAIVVDCSDYENIISIMDSNQNSFSFEYCFNLAIKTFNRQLDADTAKTIVDKQFVELIIAPSVSQEAFSHYSS
ncbi:hypothetical protein A9G25_07840 [Gilliamella sp. Bif1-4]|nr:hypothetical protein A9G25_07840 [Gilliamella apicola]